MSLLNPKTRELLNTQGEIKAYEYNMPLFITGCMRSGTTYLHNILAKHPQLLKMGFELNHAWDKIGGAPIVKECQCRDQNHLSPEFTYNMTNYYYDFIKENKSLKRKIIRGAEIMQGKPNRISYDWNHIVPVNKSPHFMNKIKYITGLFPESKIILIRRDIFAYSASQKILFDIDYKRRKKIRYYPNDSKSCWTNLKTTDLKRGSYDDNFLYPNNFSLIPKMWIKLNYLAINDLASLDNNRYLFVNYEDLILNKEAELRKIFKFLKLKEKHQHIQEKIIQKNISYKNTSTEGNSLTKWKKQLLPDEISAIENLILEEKEKYDYIINNS